MQVWQLGLLVVGGVALAVWLVHLSGGSRTAIVAGSAHAVDRFHQDFPGTTVNAVFVTGRRNAAFIDLGPKQVGLVHAIGDGFLTRVLSGHDIKKFSQEGKILALKLDDFTFCGDNYSFNDTPSAAAVAHLLRELMETKHA